MKKLKISFLLLVLTTSLVTSPVLAKGENAKGAVEADLLGGTYPDWNVVGSVILGTMPGGKLLVKLNMDTVPDLQNYNVGVVVWYTPPAVPPGEADFREIFEDVLDTNAAGQGNTQIQLDIDPPLTYSSIWVRVYVREELPIPGTNPDYRSGFPFPTEVPLK